ncbi:MAG: esterase family protein [Ignavibacteria bacterium]|nr:esterase family protein [Ignavibacteria bacterium]
MCKKFFIAIISLCLLIIGCKKENQTEFNFAENERYMIFLPSGYDNSNSLYPVLYMLHGHGGDYMQWYSIADLKQTADDNQFIIVTPEGFHDTWYLNSKTIPSMQYEDYFINDFMRRVESQFRIDTTRRGITGLSMGGHGAIKFICNYPDKFIAAASTSGILDITMFTDRWGLKKHLGDYDEFPDQWEENSCKNLIIKLLGKENQILVDCGADDFAIEANREFYKRAVENGVNLIYKESEGAHSYDYWSKSVLHHFEFFNKVFTR